MATKPRPRFPYGARKNPETELWGVWDHFWGGWIELPAHRRTMAERMARAMIRAYAAGATAAVFEKVR